jgi:site-specific DNA recombinase
MKRCGLYIRVSTERQAKVEEGSLKNQNQLLSQHIEIKNKISGEQWLIVDRYIDEGKSAKDTKGRPEYLRMMQDIERGRINTVLCTALSRISRSTRDLLDMIEIFKEKKIDFICLKEDFDTTTAQGKCFITIMGALNEFEREQTSERTRANMLARAERGLWNGGHLLGYDLSPDKKGYLISNEKEKAIVNFAFDTYLQCGSVLRTCEIVNSKGYRTKEYVSRDGIPHPAREFTYSPMLALLTNYAYIGKKEINKRRKRKPQHELSEEERYKIVDAVWEAIVPEDKFYATQKLLKDNLKHKNNGAKPTKHFYLLNGGILHCHKCGYRMEGRNAHGNKGKSVYHYYVCTNKECRFKLPESEIENAIQELLRKVSQDERILAKIVEKTNIRLKKELPRLFEQKKQLQKELDEINTKAEHIMEKYIGITEGEEFVKNNLAKLSQRRRQIEDGLEALKIVVDDIGRDSISREIAQQIFNSFDEIFKDKLKPYQKRELLYYVLTKVEMSDKQLKVGIPVERLSNTSLEMTSKDTTAPTSFPTLSRGGSWMRFKIVSSFFVYFGRTLLS